MHFRTLFSVIAGALIGPALCESEFSQPPAPGQTRDFQDNPTYHVGEDINVRWTTNLSSVNLVLWQEYPSSSKSHSKEILSDSSALGFQWTVSLDGFLTNVTKGESAILYIALYEYGSGYPDTTCHYFNISVPEALSTATTTASTATATAAASFSAVPTASATQSTSSSHSALSSGAIAGISVGATIVGILVLGGLGFFAWTRLRKENTISDPGSPNEYYPPVVFPLCEASAKPIIYEAPVKNPVYEAP